MDLDLVDLGASSLDPKTNAILHQTKGMPVDASGDSAPDYGPTPNFSCLGITSMPWPANENGKAQGIVARVDGLDAVLLGARDTRTAAVTGAMKPGDTIVHTTGPEQAAQLQLKEENRIAALVSKDSQKKTIAFTIDGTEDMVQILAFGHAFEISRENGIVISDSTGGCSIHMKDGIGCLTGTWVFGGRNPVAPLLYSLTPVVGTAGTAVPAPGLFVGV